MKTSYLLDKLDKNMALIGAFFSLILTIWIKLVINHPLIEMVGILCFIACTGYLSIRRFFHPSLIPSLEKLRCSTRFYITLNIFFFFLLSYSIITIYLRIDPYIRPLGYFISIALMTAIVATEILFLSAQKSHIYFTLCKIIIIGISLQYSQILIFPTIVGIDPWMHQWFTLKILDNGYIPEGLAYSKLPLMHLMIGMTSLITNLSYKQATMVSISTLQVVGDTLFIFLLGKFLISNKVGLLATLLLEVADQHVNFGYWTIPNTMGATLIVSIIYIILKMKIDKPFIGNSLLMFLMGTLILTHTVSALCLSILLFVFWLSSATYSFLFNHEINRPVTLKLCILYTITMLAYWSFISGHIRILVSLINMGFSNFGWLPKFFDSTSYVPFSEQIFTTLGMFLFFSLSFIGCFYIMSKQFRNINRFIIIIGGIVLLSLAFFPSILGMKIIAHRWYYFSQILLAIPLSLSIFLLTGIFKNHITKIFLMSISVFILAFLLIMSPVANIDNRTFSPNSGTRYAFTESELQAGNTISTIFNERLGIDWYYSLLFNYQLDSKFIPRDTSLDTGDFRMLSDIMIIIREETMNHPLRPLQSNPTINYNPFLVIESQNFSRIYDCGSVSGYLKP